jgi:hypothetical protein
VLCEPSAQSIKKPHRCADIHGMSATMLAPYAMLWIVLVRALLVRANVLAPTCSRCGLKFERDRLGERICDCGR